MVLRQSDLLEHIVTVSMVRSSILSRSSLPLMNKKTYYFAVFFPSLRDGDKSNHFGELKSVIITSFNRISC